MSQLLGTIRSEITPAALRLGLTPKVAAEIARIVEERVCREHGGDEVYISAQDRRAGDEAIRREWNGSNHEALCRRW